MSVDEVGEVYEKDPISWWDHLDLNSLGVSLQKDLFKEQKG